MNRPVDANPETSVARDPSLAPPDLPAGSLDALRSRTAAVNEALLISGLREHELREKAEGLADECTRLMDLAHLATLAAEKANSTKDIFLATLSHELRTPLNPALLLASEGAQNQRLSPEVRGDFAAIAKNIQLEAHLIDELLDFSKIARGKIALTMTMVSVNDVLRDAIGNVQSDLARRQLKIEFTPSADEPLVGGDPMRLQQVFWNVLKNAAKFSQRGGTVSVETVIDSPADVLTLRFSDAGIGIDPAELGEIFEPFKQGGRRVDAPGPHYGGLGLGLSIAKNIVELHGGTIRAESRGLGFGSVFTIVLPLGHSGSPSQPSLVAPRSVPGWKPHQDTPLRVLFIEDDPESRTSVQRLLVNRGIQVSSVNSFEEAMRLADLNRFDLLIADIGLPDGNGLDLLKLFAQHSPGIKGITLSGYGSEWYINLSRRAGYATHLVKPIEIRALEAALDIATHSKPPFPDTSG
jgi:signal transduction histidine kinase/CheY-like chemotaxis protein